MVFHTCFATMNDILQRYDAVRTRQRYQNGPVTSLQHTHTRERLFLFACHLTAHCAPCNAGKRCMYRHR